MANGAIKGAIEGGVGSAVTKGHNNWFGLLPIQVGPASPYARNVQHWLKAILCLQVVTCVCRFFILKEITGGCYMAVICALGWYAVKQDMNITWVCLWGLACAVNSCFDVFTLLFTLIFAIVRLNIFDVVLRILAPLSELLGVGFAWHLYLDFEEGKDSPISGWSDPMGKLVNSTDPAEYKSLLRAAKDKTIRHEIAQPFKKAGSAAMRAGSAAAAAFSSPTPAARYPQTPLPVPETPFETETQVWRQHEEVLQEQQEARQPEQAPDQPQASAFDTHDQPFQGQPSPPPTATRKKFAACC